MASVTTEQTMQVYNVSNNSSLAGNYSAVDGGEGGGGSMLTASVDAWTAFFAAMYTLICLAGLIGNALVIFVVLRYTKMKTVTNMYILNLAVADLCFLVGLPFLIVTLLLRSWVFGNLACKMFYIATSINWFTSVFTLAVMSADRYVAICHAIWSIKYRTPLVSRVVCVAVWCVSLLVMLPIMLYATTVHGANGKASCTIIWPGGQPIPADIAFIWYGLLLGFAIPVALIIVFYTLVVVRLRSVGPKKKSKEKKKSHRKVTKMVLTIIAVYVVCWLPYWIFQVTLTFGSDEMPPWAFKLFQIITMMSYANSMLNPLLYAFLSENFRKAFEQAFHCAASVDANSALQHEHSVFPRNKTTISTAAATCTQITRHVADDDDEEEDDDDHGLAAEEEELEIMTTNTTATSCDHSTSTTKFIVAADQSITPPPAPV